VSPAPFSLKPQSHDFLLSAPPIQDSMYLARRSTNTLLLWLQDFFSSPKCRRGQRLTIRPPPAIFAVFQFAGGGVLFGFFFFFGSFFLGGGFFLFFGFCFFFFFFFFFFVCAVVFGLLGVFFFFGGGFLVGFWRGIFPFPF